jgi:hypothetical protein
MEELKAATMALKEGVEKGDCKTIQDKINEVLTKAQPIRNLITTGGLQETNEGLQGVKAELRLATDAILKKCPPGAAKVNTVPKTNNAPKVNTAPNKCRSNPIAPKGVTGKKGIPQ